MSTAASASTIARVLNGVKNVAGFAIVGVATTALGGFVLNEVSVHRFQQAGLAPGTRVVPGRRVPVVPLTDTRDGGGTSAATAAADFAAPATVDATTEMISDPGLFVTAIDGSSSDAGASRTGSGGRDRAAAVLSRPRATIVVLGGLGSASFEWWPLQRRLAHEASARVVTYDRRGYGLSDMNTGNPNTNVHAAGEAGSAKAQSSELRKLIQGLPGAVGPDAPPLVLVGHSIGALYAADFARRHPDLVAGVVFVDPLADNRRVGDDREERVVESSTRGRNLLARFGVIRLFGALPFPVPESVKPQCIQHYSNPHTYDTMLAEYKRAPKGFDALTDAGSFPDVPTTVVYHSSKLHIDSMVATGVPRATAEAKERAWADVARDTYAAGAPGTADDIKWVESTKALHAIHTDDPDAVVSAVVDVVDRASRAATRRRR